MDKGEPRRWVVERTFAAATRRLAKDFGAVSIPGAEAWVLIASLRLPHGDERKLNFPFWCHSNNGR